MKTKRDKAVEIGYDVSEWIGEMAIAYSPAMFFVAMAMATVSIALRGAIATNVAFDVLWAVATAVCVDGLWLGVWLRLHSSKITNWATGLKYMATLAIAIFMFLVCAAMSILVTYQQVNGLSDELLGMNNLHVDSLTFVIARGILVVLCATLAIPFRLKKQEAIATEKKARATKQATVATPTITITPVTSPQLAALPAGNRSQEYEKIKATMATFIADGKKLVYSEIASASGAGYSTVKKWAPKIRQELEGRTN